MANYNGIDLSQDSLNIAKYLTIHTSGNLEMLKAAQDSASGVKLLGVTVLTSQSNLEGVGIKN